MSRHPAVIQQIRDLAAAGRIDESEAVCAHLLTTVPEDPEAWAWYSLLKGSRQQWMEAEAAARQAVCLRPDHPPYLNCLSNAVRCLRRPQEAESLARKAIARDATQDSSWMHLAAALADQRKLEDALRAYRHALHLNPANPAIWQALASVQQDLGDLDAAQQAFERCLELAPHGTATIGYAYLLSQRGDFCRAAALLSDFVTRAPQFAIAWAVLCHVHLQLEEIDKAELACGRALALDPGLLEGRIQHIEVLIQRFLILDAEAAARRLVADEPELAAGWKMLGLALGLRAAHEESHRALRRALELAADPVAHSKLLIGLQYAPGADAQTLLCHHQAWASRYGQDRQESIARPAIGHGRSQKLRIGFVSQNFCQHAIAFLALPLLEHLDKGLCSIICYSDGPRSDAWTARFRRSADEWRFTFGIADQAFRQQVIDDRIGILFDLAGHFGSRLAAFAHRMAPVQMTWLGYVGTTGLPAMDYLVADNYHIRRGEERWYTEGVLRMPHGYACYGPPAYAPPVTPLPAFATGRVTFGCLNNPMKYSPATFDAWAAILALVPNSRLLLKYCWRNATDLRSCVEGEFEQRGISAKRIVVEGDSSHGETLAAYGRIDLALDTQPYSGGLTTCEALWMGVPVITWPGRTFAGRHSTSHLTNAGYPQFIAEDQQEYVRLAIEWAGRPDDLAVIRRTLRDRMRGSPLCDGPQFARDFLMQLQGVLPWQLS